MKFFKDCITRISFVLMTVLLISGSGARAAAETTLPLSVHNGKPVVEFEVGGKRFPFIIDTGSNQALHLTPEVMASLPGLKLTGRMVKSYDLTGRVQESAEFVVPDLVMNGVSFGLVTGSKLVPWGLEMGKAPSPEVAVSVLGLPLFARQPFIYDLPGRSLRIGLPASGLAGWTPLPHEQTGEGIVAAFGSARSHYRMVLDSGASTSAISRRRVLAAADVSVPCDLNLGGRECDYVFLSLNGGPVLTPLLLDMPDALHADGIVGADFFQHYAVFVDLAAGQVQLRPAGAQ